MGHFKERSISNSTIPDTIWIQISQYTLLDMQLSKLDRNMGALSLLMLCPSLGPTNGSIPWDLILRYLVIKACSWRSGQEGLSIKGVAKQALSTLDPSTAYRSWDELSSDNCEASWGMKIYIQVYYTVSCVHLMYQNNKISTGQFPTMYPSCHP